MNKSAQLLSDVVCYTKYSRWLPDKQRRETWEELVTRNRDMHIRKFPELEQEIKDVYQLVYEKKVLPSMRQAQFSGKPIELSPVRGYNCSYVALDNWEVFFEIIFLLLSGVGVGIGVQRHHVEQLPEIKPHLKRTRRHLVGDSIEGWADSIKVLMKSYFFGLSKPRFDFGDIRPKGTMLVTSGGRAPGPQPLKDCIHHITAIMDTIEPGEKLTSIQCYDITNHIADCVLAGGIRRAALISLFSLEDEVMLNSKLGDWSELNPQRGRSNNSVVLLRHKITRKRFHKLFERIRQGNGEPGIFLTNDKEMGCNPCNEISLKNKGLCNLTTINLTDVKDQAELNKRAEIGAALGTLQAAYTDFHYLNQQWQKQAEKESLIGVSLTGLARSLDGLDLVEAAEIVKETNKKWSKLLGINEAARCCAVKPSGSASLVVNSSSGVHAWFAPYYIRRMRVLKTEALYKYMKRRIPQLVEDDYFQPATQGIVSIPVKAPEDAITRNDETTLDQLERIKKINMEWVHPGHRSGENYNNTSATVFVHEDEWEMVEKWMWENRQYYTGITVIPYDSGNYKQPPFQEITEEKYEEMMEHIKELNLDRVREEEDFTTVKDIAACSSGACDISLD